MVFRKKSSDGVDKVNSLWSIKGLVSRLKKKNSELEELMVIGIDFGTTYVFFSWPCLRCSF